MNIAFSWDEFEVAAAHLAGALSSTGFEAVVALPRGGLILGVRLAHLLGDLPVVVPWVDWDGEQGEYVVTLPPKLAPRDDEPSVLLLVDDVVSVGRLMTRVIEALQLRFPKATSLSAAALFVDSKAISDGPWRALLDRLQYFQSIDNRRTWVDFSWEHIAIPQSGQWADGSVAVRLDKTEN